MVFPQFKRKHIEEALFSPKDFIKYKKFKTKFPSRWIIAYQKSGMDYFLRKYKPRKVRLYSTLNVYFYKSLGFVRMNGIGSPHATTLMEELIALGGKDFINIGTAGGLQHQGVFLCNKALRDEGTSHHYIPHGKFVSSDKKLSKRLETSMKKRDIDYSIGSTWTTDAPYRETKKEIQKYHREGITTVEMEASALFAVAKYRGVRIASAFVVSDILGQEWDPRFHRVDVRKNLNLLIDSAVDCLTRS